MFPRIHSHAFRRTTATTALLLSLSLTACASSPSQGDSPTTAPGYPLTVENCASEVTFNQPPQRIMLLDSAAIASLHDLGVLDKVVARAGAYPAGYFDEQTRAELDKIPELTDRLDSSGHLQISKDAIVSERPDLVMGETTNITRDELTSLGINLLQEPGQCVGGAARPTFKDVYAQVSTYGRVFDREEAAQEVNSQLKERVAAAQTSAEEHVKPRTAAVLYPTPGGGVTYAYGAGSMSNAQLETAGLKNVFGDSNERVFEVTTEELIARNPDVLILLHADGSDDAPLEALRKLPGIDQVTAVKNNEVMPQLLYFSELPTPLAVTGLERIVDRFSA